MIDLLFPNICHVCNRPLMKGEKILCMRCANDLPRTNFHHKEGNLAEQRLYGKCDFEKCACFCYYQKGHAFTHLIHRFKYNGFKEIGYYLGYMFAQELKNQNWHYDINALVPVPLHPVKRFKRGFEQTKIIAKGIQRSWHIPIVDNLILKTKNNPSQTKKDMYERYENSIDSFRLNEKNIKIPRHILIIDDIFTSGSTVESCIHLFDNIDNVKISVLTIGFAE